MMKEKKMKNLAKQGVACVLIAVTMFACTKTSYDSGSSSSVSPSCTPTTTFTGTQTASVTVPAGACYGFTGLVIFSAGTTFSIGAGAKLVGTAGQAPPSSIIIQPGAKIDAQGTALSPIVFTSSANVGSRASADWGGLVIRGNASHNIGNGATNYTSEFDDSYTWGANASSDTESSGTLKYVRVEFGGKQTTLVKEYNGITFEMVGSGTTVDYIHSHRVGDDPVEFFGGTVNVKHVISSAFGDDGFDWTYGYRGKAQFVVVNMTDGDSNQDSNGIEADNNDLTGGDTRTPYSNPTLYNFTIVSSGKKWRNIMMLRRGTKGSMYNFYVANWCDTIRVQDLVNLGCVTQGNVVAGSLVIKNSLFEGISYSTANDSKTCSDTSSTSGAIYAGAGTGAGVAHTSKGHAAGATGGLLDVIDATQSCATGYTQLVSDSTVTMNASVGNGLSAANWVSDPAAGAWKPSAPISTNAATPPNDGFYDTTATYMGAIGSTDWTTWTAYPTN